MPAPWAPRWTLLIMVRTDQIAPEGRKHLAGGLNHGAELWGETASVDLAKGLIEEVADPAELTDDGVICTGHRRNFDSAVLGERPG